MMGSRILDLWPGQKLEMPYFLSHLYNPLCLMPELPLKQLKADI